MITQEMLAQQEVLNGLTDEQREAILTLSKNDEEAVIGNRFREVYNKLDETIARETGIARNGDEKTYVYLERAAKAVKAQADKVDGLQTKVNELTNERNRLQKVIDDGTVDEQTKKQLAQAQKDLAAITEQFNTLKADKDKMEQTHAREIMDVRIENELAQASAGIKFKAELPKQAVDTLLQQTIQRVKGMTPDYIDDGRGGKRLVFKDAQGAIMRNPEKQLEPYTAGELLQRELKAMGILDEGRKAAGGGTEPPAGGGGAGAVVDVSAARTQTEAQDIIAQALMKQGMTNGSKEFQEAMTKAWRDNNIAKLPIK
jgi:hypothetical protein